MNPLEITVTLNLVQLYIICGALSVGLPGILGAILYKRFRFLTVIIFMLSLFIWPLFIYEALRKARSTCR